MKRQTEIHICQGDYLTIHFAGDIHFAWNWYGDAEIIREKLCSRPHTSPPAPASSQSYGQNDQIPPCKDCPCETPHCRKNCRYCEMYLLGAKAAREQFTMAFLRYIKEAPLDSWSDFQIERAIDCCMRAEESLRAQPEPQQ